MNIILTTSCDDNFIDLLLAMMESLGDRLEQHAFGVCDLGLTEESKDKVRKLKPDVIFKEAKWFIDALESKKNVYTLGNQSKVFACDIFPNYDGYVHIDSDVWFADASALDDMIEAGQKHGVSCVYERKLFMKNRKKFLGITIYRKKVPIVYDIFADNYGEEVANRLGPKSKRRMNGGFYYIEGGHKFWDFYRDAGRKSIANLNKYDDKIYFSDQNAFLYALLDTDVPHEVLPYTHNCIEKRLTFDKSTGDLYYPYCPDAPVKVVHLTGKNKETIRKLKTTNGGTIKTSLTYHAIKKLKENL